MASFTCPKCSAFVIKSAIDPLGCPCCGHCAKNVPTTVPELTPYTIPYTVPYIAPITYPPYDPAILPTWPSYPWASPETVNPWWSIIPPAPTVVSPNTTYSPLSTGGDTSTRIAGTFDGKNITSSNVDYDGGSLFSYTSN